MGFTACSDAVEPEEQTQSPEIEATQEETAREMTVVPDDAVFGVIDTEMPSISLGETAARISKLMGGACPRLGLSGSLARPSSR